MYDLRMQHKMQGNITVSPNILSMSTSVVRCSNAGGTEDVGIRAAGFGPGQMRKCATAMIDREVEILKERKSLVW
jgi:hypothetical protein